MKIGEFRIIGQGMFAALVTPMDELHPEIPLVLVGDDAKYLYFNNMARRGAGGSGILLFIDQFEKSERFKRNREFYRWLRDTVSRRPLTCVNKEPAAKGQKGKGAR